MRGDRMTGWGVYKGRLCLWTKRQSDSSSGLSGDRIEVQFGADGPVAWIRLDEWTPVTDREAEALLDT